MWKQMGRRTRLLLPTALLATGMSALPASAQSVRPVKPLLTPLAVAAEESSNLQIAPEIGNKGQFGALTRPETPEATIDSDLIEPIDWLTVIRLSGERDLDIGIARERLGMALAELQESKTLLLPSLYLGPNWIRHDGQAQLVDGTVKSISKSSLFLGGSGRRPRREWPRAGGRSGTSGRPDEHHSFQRRHL